jgi:nucleotide-binding universal stress UspA family protein
MFAPGAILVPVVFSEISFPHLAFAGNLASESSASLVLLHVVQLNIAGEEFGIPRSRLVNELCRDAEKQLRELAGCLEPQAVVETLVCEGQPAAAIVATARHLQAAAIVMRMKRRRGWLKWLHRNTALEVARQAPCKVWLVSHEEQAGTLHLSMVHLTGAGSPPGSGAAHEKQNPLRSLLRVPFS